MVTQELVQRLPKIELHCHLDGSLRLESLIDIAQTKNINLPSTEIETLHKLLTFSNKRGSLEDYLKAFEVTLSVMQTPEDLERIAFELIEDVAKENVKYIEVRYSPILHTEQGMTPSESIDAVKAGLEKGKKEFGVSSGIIICGIRNISPEASLKLADLTLPKIKALLGLILQVLRKTSLQSIIKKLFI